ncbi:hypothetical protein LWC34_36025 [Kibdelosporangium philippinense]|uniref:Uncharacterized protein n=1 Tax=Kibdelosporangium philippinense TaxID=211113 RepID=A0ABS8ZLZ8_9PSEU|nr:hypothetical protein [Kibdelosporangium philippinense]MCE7008188.1 hypothetical protein [Kibdelosporangium philippinense]
MPTNGGDLTEHCRVAIRITDRLRVLGADRPDLPQLPRLLAGLHVQPASTVGLRNVGREGADTYWPDRDLGPFYEN